MKMKINKNELKEALEIVKPGLANVELIEQTTSFAFVNGNVITYNDEISLSHPIPGLDITGAVQATELYQFLNKIKKDEIDFEIKDNEIVITAGKSKAGLTLQEEIKLPLNEIEKKLDWKAIPEKFSFDRLKFTAKSCSNDMSYPTLTCVNMRDNGFLESSDRFKICRIKSEPLPVPTFLLPAKTVDFVCQLKPTDIARSDGWVHFKTNKGTILSCRIFEEKFPEIKDYFIKDGKTITFPKNIENILDKADIFTKRQVLIDESVYITFSNNQFLLQGKSETGWYEEKANVKYEGEEISFIVAPMLLKYILNEIKTCKIYKNNIIFSNEILNYLVLLKKQ